MAELGKQFSFVVGEVSPEFFGREDLAKYPLGAAEVENFIVDYRGGLFNRPGFEYCFNLPRAVYRPVPFRSFGDDYILLFTNNRFYVQRNGGLVLTGDFWFAGKCVYIDHGAGLISFYCHLSKVSASAGSSVQRGEIIGLSGKSGRVTGPHLHFSLSWRGEFFDPAPLFEVGT